MKPRGHPLWRFDRQQLRESGAGALIGVDEAGRGALAGPVVAAVALIPIATYEDPTFRRDSRAINDSKQLSPAVREGQFRLIQQWECAGWLTVLSAHASVAEIEALNILGATRLAMQRALNGLACALCPNESSEDDLFGPPSKPNAPRIVVDGNPLKPFPWRHEGVVGGDGKSLAIAMASIVAKVTRDQLMSGLHEVDNRFGFDQHKGYGAPQHWDAIRAHGPTPNHRIKFLRKLDPPRARQTAWF